jgi:4-hydroxybenzoate polyprenyltransferase
METNLQPENINLDFEYAKLKFETLFNERPSTFRSLAFHGGLRIIYFILGLISFISGIVLVTYTASVLALINQAKASVERTSEKKIVGEALDAAFPTNVYLCAAIVALALCFLVMARLCRKIMKRNMYIMDLENIWLGMTDKKRF